MARPSKRRSSDFTFQFDHLEVRSLLSSVSPMVDTGGQSGTAAAVGPINSSDSSTGGSAESGGSASPAGFNNQISARALIRIEQSQKEALYVSGLYHTVLHRAAQPREVASWVRAMNQGASPESVLFAIAMSPEHQHLPAAQGNAGGTGRGATASETIRTERLQADALFVAGVYNTLLDRTARPQEIASWVRAMDHGLGSKGVVHAIASSREHRDLIAAQGNAGSGVAVGTNGTTGTSGTALPGAAGTSAGSTGAGTASGTTGTGTIVGGVGGTSAGSTGTGSTGTGTVGIAEGLAGMGSVA